MNAKGALLVMALLSALLFLTGGCQSSNGKPPIRGKPALETRNNCYSLLHQLLDEQKDVSILRFIKREHPEIKNLIIKIPAENPHVRQCQRGAAAAYPTT